MGVENERQVENRGKALGRVGGGWGEKPDTKAEKGLDRTRVNRWKGEVSKRGRW